MIKRIQYSNFNPKPLTILKRYSFHYVDILLNNVVHGGVNPLGKLAAVMLHFIHASILLILLYLLKSKSLFGLVDLFEYMDVCHSLTQKLLNGFQCNFTTTKLILLIL